MSSLPESFKSQGKRVEGQYCDDNPALVKGVLLTAFMVG